MTTTFPTVRLERAGFPAVLVGADGRIAQANRAWAACSSCGAGDDLLAGWSDLGPVHAEALADGLREVIDGARPAFGLDYAGADGGRSTVMCTPADGGALVARVDSPASCAAVAAGSALCDELTGLANRRMFLDRLRATLDEGRSAGVLFLDLDDFKLVNDGYGHAAGDALLAEVARRLSHAVRPLDLVARLGGDEFAVICHDVEGEHDVLAIAQRLRCALAAPVDVGGHQRTVRASIGCRLLEHGAVLTAEEATDVLVRDADVAMYQAKEAGKDRVELYSAATRERLVHRLELESDLRRAVDAEELDVHYQPHVDLVTGAVVGVEALLRWPHAERGMVSPCEFIPVAEQSGLIVPLGDLVLARTCADLATWRAQGLALTASINVAVQQLADPGFAHRLLAALAGAGLAPADLCVEVTESTLMDADGPGLRTLSALHDAGVYVAIDDFGTGFSSLSYLKQLPVEVLKVDRSFVDGLGTDPDDSAIVASILSLAHAMGLHVVAEGVETGLQAEELLALGCTVAQGFRFSPAVPAAEIPALARTAERRRRGPGPGRRAARGFIEEFVAQLGLPEERA